jgi:hypothetical protein
VSEFDCGFWISDFRIQVSGVPPQADQVSGIQGLSNSGIEGIENTKHQRCIFKFGETRK